MRDLVVAELQNYEEAKGKLFSYELARRGRTTQNPSIILAIWILESKVIDNLIKYVFTFHFAF